MTSFARAIGEIHSLSRADLHLIALAHSLHTSLHGEHSLHREPAPARALAKGKHVSRLMPGWGAAGGKWEEMDKLEEAEKTALEQAQGKAPTHRSRQGQFEIASLLASVMSMQMKLLQDLCPRLRQQSYSVLETSLVQLHCPALDSKCMQALNPQKLFPAFRAA